MPPATGRPKDPNARRKVLSVHLSDEEAALVASAAEKNGQAVTAYIRDAVVAKAKRAR